MAKHCCTIGPTALVNVIDRHPIVSATFHGHEHTLAYTHLDGTRLTSLTHPVEEFAANAGVWHTHETVAGRTDYSMTQGCPEDSRGYCDSPIHGFVVVDVSGSTYRVSAYRTYTVSAYRRSKHRLAYRDVDLHQVEPKQQSTRLSANRDIISEIATGLP